jgi:M6 family metalloprotease-like protein
MLFVDFPNARAADNAAPYDEVGAYYDFLAPAADWYRRSSYGLLSLQITPVPTWFHMSLPDSDYGIVRTMPLATQTRYVRDVVELADSDVDFSAFDLVYIVPSRNARGIALSPAYVDAGDDPVTADGVTVRHGVTFGRDMWSWGFKILAHETNHTFGLPDLYLEPGDTHAAVRGWDLMGNIAGRQPDLFAWHKWKHGWLRDDQIDCVTEPGTTEHRIAPVERPGGTKAVVVRTGERTAYVIESRRQIGNDPDACSTGVLVYAVNSPMRSGEGPIRVIDATPGSPPSPGCSDLDIATLDANGASTLALPNGVTIEVVGQSTLTDTVMVTRQR